MNTKPNIQVNISLSKDQKRYIEEQSKDIEVLVKLYRNSIDAIRTKSKDVSLFIGPFNVVCYTPMVILKSLYYHGSTFIDIILNELNRAIDGNN